MYDVSASFKVTFLHYFVYHHHFSRFPLRPIRPVKKQSQGRQSLKQSKGRKQEIRQTSKQSKLITFLACGILEKQNIKFSRAIKFLSEFKETFLPQLSSLSIYHHHD